MESCVVILVPREKDEISIEEREKVMALAKPFFTSKRKQMAGVLKQNYRLDSREEAAAVLAKANIRDIQRPQELSVAQWRALASVL